MRLVKICILSVLTLSLANAQNITFGTVSKESQKAFKSYWKLSDEDVSKYNTYMEIAGKYRHQQSNPLVVLSIISDDPEDKGYYAAKAAKYESDMAQREITSAWLLSNEMEKQGLVDAMDKFSSELTGVDTSNYVPGRVKKDWEKGDTFVLVVDDICRQTNCLTGYIKTVNAIPKHVAKTVLFKNFKAAYDEKALELFTKQQPTVQFKRFDSVEHGSLSNVINQAVQVRDGKVLRKI